MQINFKKGNEFFIFKNIIQWYQVAQQLVPVLQLDHCILEPDEEVMWSRYFGWLPTVVLDYFQKKKI